MGMYTELLIKVDIFRDLPENVKFILNFLFNPESENDIWDKNMNIRSDIDIPDHKFFKSERWTQIGRCNSFYHIPACCNHYEEGYLFSRSDLKNYDNEIEYFLDWINPYIDLPEGRFIGWIWYEEFKKPEFIYKK